MDFDKPKVYGDTSITDGLVYVDLYTYVDLYMLIYISQYSANEHEEKKDPDPKLVGKTAIITG